MLSDSVLAQHHSFFMEVPDDAHAPSEVVTISFAIESDAIDESLRAVDNDVSKKGKRMNYQYWEIDAIVYDCNAACVTKPQSTVSFATNTFAITSINLRINV